jgi:Ca2+-binding EF-hand superfamily protein
MTERDLEPIKPRRSEPGLGAPIVIGLLGVGLILFATLSAKAMSPREAFALADENRDNKLDVVEFETYIRSLADFGDEQARSVMLKGAQSDAFIHADKNSDGSVSPDEL